MGDRVQADIKTAIERAIDFNHHAAQWDADDWAPIEAAISKGIADVRAATVAECMRMVGARALAEQIADMLWEDDAAINAANAITGVFDVDAYCKALADLIQPILVASLAAAVAAAEQEVGG